jgi:hypothetical protein
MRVTLTCPAHAQAQLALADNEKKVKQWALERASKAAAWPATKWPLLTLHPPPLHDRSDAAGSQQQPRGRIRKV